MQATVLDAKIARLQRERDQIELDLIKMAERCETLRRQLDYEIETHNKTCDQRDRLRAALEPFARNVNALSLNQALGHIEREHLLAARKALANQAGVALRA